MLFRIKGITKIALNPSQKTIKEQHSYGAQGVQLGPYEQA
jgi:hypothetical protein